MKCNLCGKYIPSYMKMETRYNDYEPYEEPVEYPMEGHAHLVLNYICNDCYDNFEEKIRSSLIAEDKKYESQYNNRLEKARLEYENNLLKIKRENERVKELTDNLVTADMGNLNMKDYSLLGDFPYTSGATLYIGRIKKVREEKENGRSNNT